MSELLPLGSSGTPSPPREPGPNPGAWTERFQRAANPELGRLIRERRQKAGWTLKQLAGKVGYDPDYLSHVELGRRAPDWDLRQRLAGVLGLELEVLNPPVRPEPDPAPPYAQARQNSRETNLNWAASNRAYEREVQQRARQPGRPIYPSRPRPGPPLGMMMGRFSPPGGPSRVSRT
jgi:transcriptional regulator with XRE-family HTH domain